MEMDHTKIKDIFQKLITQLYFGKQLLLKVINLADLKKL